jgi:hypothetical protein
VKLVKAGKREKQVKSVKAEKQVKAEETEETGEVGEVGEVGKSFPFIHLYPLIRTTIFPFGLDPEMPLVEIDDFCRP